MLKITNNQGMELCLKGVSMIGDQAENILKSKRITNRTKTIKAGLEYKIQKIEGNKVYLESVPLW